MIWIIIIVVSILCLIAIANNKGAEKSTMRDQSKRAANEYTPKALRPFEPHERWKAEREKEIKEELQKIESGFYDNYKCIEFDIAGTYYRTKLAKETLLSLDLISSIKLVPEPDNPHDKFAVKLVYDRKWLGYVPRGYSKRIFEAVKSERIIKLFVMDNGSEFYLEPDDSIFTSIRVYYQPSQEELKEERLTQEKLIKEKEAKAQRMQEPVILPNWITNFLQEINATSVNDDSKKWELNRIKENVRRSVKSYENAIRQERESIANNAENRLRKYQQDLNVLLKR